MAEKRGDSCTVFLYDGLSRLTNVITARGLVTAYEYDELGFLKSKTTPDEGKINYKSDKYGNLRFVYYSSESQSGPYTVYFSNYDQLHHLKTKGSFQITNAAAWNSLNPDVLSSDEGMNHNWLVVNLYDKTNQTTSPFNGIPGYSRNNLKGRLSQTAFRDKTSDNWNYKLYSYDPSGRVSFYWIKPSNGSYMKIENYYNIAGNLTCQILPGEEQRFYYTYDAQGQFLDSVKNGKAGEFKIFAKYFYTNDDKIKDIKLYNRNQGHCYTISNTYNPKRGWVNSITGNYAGIQNTFIENLTYLHNGLVSNQQIFNSLLSPSSITHSFEYDSKNQLTNFTYSLDPSKNQTYTYDADGNIKSIK